jgi:hypothetical protein
MKYKLSAFFLPSICLALCFSSQTLAQDQEELLPVKPPQELTLIQAVMCEGLRGIVPLNEAKVFSIRREKVHCFFDFAPVPEKTSIFVSWYLRDVRRLNRRYTLYPPKWSVVDSIELRDADKGPWRVEVRDADGNILETLRFSITD